MHGTIASRHAIVALVDQVARLNGRLKSTFAPSRQGVGLGESESMVLNAVVEAVRPPTVAQIGRSLGYPRQLIQRAANALKGAGLITLVDNPDHKRAALLRPTSLGLAVKRRADAIADRIAAELAPGLDDAAVADLAEALRAIRATMEARLRVRGGTGGTMGMEADDGR